MDAALHHHVVVVAIAVIEDVGRIGSGGVFKIFVQRQFSRLKKKCKNKMQMSLIPGNGRWRQISRHY